MGAIRLRNGGAYMVSPNLWECFSLEKSHEMLDDFCKWCRENEDQMETDAKLLVRAVKRDWEEALEKRSE